MGASRQLRAPCLCTRRERGRGVVREEVVERRLLGRGISRRARRLCEPPPCVFRERTARRDGERTTEALRCALRITEVLETQRARGDERGLRGQAVRRTRTTRA